MTPKTWTAREITQLIEDEIRVYRADCTARGRAFDAHELAECIYSVLNDQSLIEDTP